MIRGGEVHSARSVHLLPAIARVLVDLFQLQTQCTALEQIVRILEKFQDLRRFR